MLQAHLQQRLLQLGTYAHAQGIFHGDNAQVGLLVLVGLVASLWLGTILASRLVAPGSWGQALALALVWAALCFGWDAAQVLGHLNSVGAQALLTLSVGSVMVSITHRVLSTSWGTGIMVVGLGFAMGGLVAVLGSQVLKMFSAIG